MNSMHSLLEDARKKLVGTGTKNRLIHINRSTERGNFLNIINEQSDAIFGILRVAGRSMNFAGKGQDSEEESDGINFVGTEGEDEFDVGRYTDSVLETPLTPNELQKRLLKLYRSAKTAEEEQGINIMFLSMGFLQWYEDEKSEVLRQAPLILMPVELIRHKKKATYQLVCRDDDIVTNLPLQERFIHTFGLELPEIDDSESWTPASYFDAVEQAVASKPRWQIDRDGMQLGFFSFAKLLMFRDLDPAVWNDSSLMDHPLVQGLLSGGDFSEDPLFKDGDNLDEALPPDRLLHVVDADSSQTKVIEEVRSGRNLVVQGPPGTGKSQTITNILAAAAHDGKSILFVAEKMAALDVVFNRMGKVGLQDLCLELHSRTANKRMFLQKLSATLANAKNTATAQSDTTDLKQHRDELNRLATLLHSPVANRHYTPFQVIAALSEYMSQDRPAPKFDAAALEIISADQEAELFDRLAKFQGHIDECGWGNDNPYYGAQNLNLQPTELRRLVESLQDTLDQLDDWIQYISILVQQLDIDPSGILLSDGGKYHTVYQALQSAPEVTTHYTDILLPNLELVRFTDAITAGSDWLEHKLSLADTVTTAVWNQDLDHLRLPLVRGVGSWLSRIFGNYRSASNELQSYLQHQLPKQPAERLKLLDSIIEGRRKKLALDDESEYLKRILGENWRGDKTPFDQIDEVIAWLKSIIHDLGGCTAEKINAFIASELTAGFQSDQFMQKYQDLTAAIDGIGGMLELPDLCQSSENQVLLQDLQQQLVDMHRQKDRYYEWTKYQSLRNSLLAFPVQELLDLLNQKTIPLEEIANELRYALYEKRWQYCLSTNDEIKQFQNKNRHIIVEQFIALEKARVQDVQSLILDQHLNQIPQGSSGQMAVIKGEIGKKSRHMPIRKLISKATDVVQRMKPIFFMSPISVAQFLPPNQVAFDLLVIDEASQVRPEDALGAIARAKQIVVVGDQKQLPPTTFFERLTDNSADFDEDDDNDDVTAAAPATEMESILSLCETRGLNERMLEWHYRSKDPSLICISNLEFYDNRLKLPPCPAQADKEYGLKLVRVPGVYASKSNRVAGRVATNRIEAEKIVDRLRQIAMDRPSFSVGIVAFSKSQADMITEVLELRRRNDDKLDAFLRSGKNEEVFVKNIENVQGDERDIILISVGYGPATANGRLTRMMFGPINSEGGERRLNVLFSRSRVACEVFVSFKPSDIDLSKISKRGPVVLKKFLEYAESGKVPEVSVSVGEPDSQFEVDVANAIRSLGYEAVYQVGSAGFKIDIGVKKPDGSNHFILAVECDGATYHSALSARERDRFRQAVLESKGWIFHRIWSTDWFYRRKPELQRLKDALAAAKLRDVTASIVGSNTQWQQRDTVQSPPIASEPGEPSAFIPANNETMMLNLPLYQKADIELESNLEPHDIPMDKVKEFVEKVVLIEGPIHQKEVARRFAEGTGKTRVGNRISEHVLNSLNLAKQAGALTEHKEFWGTVDQFDNVTIRDRSELPASMTKAEYISPHEFIACKKLIETENGPIEIDELVQVIAKTLGFKRAGPDFQKVAKAALTNTDET